jgi:hypothetical protein
MNQENETNEIHVSGPQQFCLLHISAFGRSQWGRVDIKLISFYTNNAFDKLHYQKHDEKQNFA